MAGTVHLILKMFFLLPSNKFSTDDSGKQWSCCFFETAVNPHNSQTFYANPLIWVKTMNNPYFLVKSGLFAKFIFVVQKRHNLFTAKKRRCPGLISSQAGNEGCGTIDNHKEACPLLGASSFPVRFQLKI